MVIVFHYVKCVWCWWVCVVAYNILKCVDMCSKINVKMKKSIIVFILAYEIRG